MCIGAAKEALKGRTMKRGEGEGPEDSECLQMLKEDEANPGQ